MFFVLLILMLINVLQNRKIYSFRSDDELWSGWGSQVFGTLILIIGFLGFIVGFTTYEFLTHPEFLGIGYSNLKVLLDMIIRNPLRGFPLLIFALVGFIIASLGMSLSIIGINRFIKNIEKTKTVRNSGDNE